MELDEILEEGEAYSSPADFLEKAEDYLTDDQTYWVENSTGEKRTVESFEGLMDYLKNKEEEWRNLREFVPVNADSHLVTHKVSEGAEYFGIEFPYTVMETDYGSRSGGRIGSIRFGYLDSREVDVSAEVTSRKIVDS